MNYDALIIGAGNGGLSAASHLAKSGKKVLVFEKHHLPGGFATSFVRGRFEFEVSLHELCLFTFEKSDARVRCVFDEIGLTDKVDWRKIPEAFSLTAEDIPGIDGYVLPFGIKEYIDKIESYVPEARKSAEQFFYLAEKIEETISFISSFRSGINLNKITKALTKHHVFLRLAMYSVEEVMSALKFSSETKRILQAYWSYLGVDCSRLNFASFCLMMNAYIKYGATVPHGRSQELSNAFVECIEENGGSVWLNSTVVEVIIENNRACGIRLADGKEIRCNHIIADISPDIVYGRLINQELVPTYCKKLTNSRKPAGRGFVVFLGLNRSPEDLGISVYNRFITNFSDSDMEFKAMEHAATNRYIAAICLNKAVPDCSPENTTIITLTTLIFSDEWGDLSPEEYVLAKRHMAEKMIDTFEKSTKTTIRDYIEEIEIATPETFARYTDTPHGSIYGYLADETDGVMHRSIFDGLDEKLEGLHFCGGYGSMLNGFSSTIINGYSASQKTIDDINKESAK